MAAAEGSCCRVGERELAAGGGSWEAPSHWAFVCTKPSWMALRLSVQKWWRSRATGAGEVMRGSVKIVVRNNGCLVAE